MQLIFFFYDFVLFIGIVVLEILVNSSSVTILDAYIVNPSEAGFSTDVTQSILFLYLYIWCNNVCIRI